MSKAWEQTLDNEMQQQETFVRFGDVENGNYTKFNADGTREDFYDGISQGALSNRNLRQKDSQGLYPQNDFIEKNIQTIAPDDALGDDIVFVKHRDDYKEFSVYLPTDKSNENWARYYFGNRLNVGNDGFCRLTFASFASLSGSVGDAFTENNTDQHVLSVAGVADVITGTGNQEYAVKVRTGAGGAEDFVTGTHGHETLQSFTMYEDDVIKDYTADYTLNARNVVNKIRFVVVTRAEFFDNATDWAEITYDCTIDKTGYNFTVSREIIAAAETSLDYANLFMAPGSTNTQKYQSGFDNISYSGAFDKVLNTFDDSLDNRVPFSSAAFYSPTYAVLMKTSFLPSIYAQYAALIADVGVLGLDTSRTDNFNKVYNRSYDESWQTLSIGDVLNTGGCITIRNGVNVDSLEWGNDNGGDTYNWIGLQ